MAFSSSKLNTIESEIKNEDIFNFRLNGVQLTMILTFEIFGRARNHGKKFLKLCQTSFSGIVHWFLLKLKVVQLT